MPRRCGDPRGSSRSSGWCSWWGRRHGCGLVLGQESLSASAGSCWHIDDEDTAQLVSCEDAHEYKAVSLVDDIEQCPGEIYLEGDDARNYLCLQQD